MPMRPPPSRALRIHAGRTHGPRSPNAIPALAAALAFLGPVACSTRPPPVEHARAYPAQLTQGRTLDVQVFLRPTTLELTNTSAIAFGPSTLWLNRWWSRPIGALGVGQSLSIPLIEFRDEFGEPFNGSGFFDTRIPDRLVLSQIETAGPDGAPVLLGLVTVGGRPEDAR